MAELKTSLERLETLATRLNNETDQVNALIARVEDRLTKLSLGVSIWLELEGWPVLLDAVSSEPVCGEQLGYSKVGDRWRIAVRTVFVHHRSVEGDDFLELRNVSEPRPLLESSRVTRVEACAHLTLLVDELAKKVEGFLNALEIAKTAAAKP